METQLVPFRTLALQVYQRSDSEALEKLAQRITRLEEKTVDLREYAEVATYDFTGNKSLGGGVSVSSPVAGWNAGLFEEKGGGSIVWQCNSDALRQYESTIAKHPQYPFPYYFLAACLQEGGSQSWRSYARVGIAILEKTTKIDGHNPGHDGALSALKSMLEQ